MTTKPSEGSTEAVRERVPVLASRDGIALTLGILFGMGAMCPKCGYGTRVTSKRWAKCKKCGERVARRTADDVGARLDAAVRSHESEVHEAQERGLNADSRRA